MSSKNTFFDWRQFKEKVAMGERVGRIVPFLKDTACVHVEEREIIAWCEIYPLLNPEDKEFNEFLKNVAVPALTKLGMSKWYRDTITDLALALSQKERGKVEESAKDILKDIPQ